MVLGTEAKAVYQWWIGRIAKLFKGKEIRRRAVPLSGGLPAADMPAVCEWYSPIPGTATRKVYFRDTSDRTKYPFANLIGARLLTRPRGPQVIGGVPAGAGWLPVNRRAPAAASATWFSDISVLQNGLIAMHMLLSAMLRMVNPL